MYENENNRMENEILGEIHDVNVNEENPKKKNSGKKRNRKNGWASKVAGVAALGLVFGLTAGATFQAVNVAGNSLNSQTETASTETVRAAVNQVSHVAATSTEEVDGTLTVSQVAETILPATVAINCTGTQVVNTIWGNAQQEYSSCGTGIIVGQNDEELLIATNNHVVDGSDTVSVSFCDDTEAAATVKGTDSDNDLAVVAVKLSDISGDTMTAITIAELGDSDALTVGEEVVAVGNALGYGQSVTSGVVSALNREVTTEASSNNYLIQTDAAINPGNSGGALVNMQGQVIGINSAKYSAEGVEGMGYAIPVNVASPIINELMNRETRTEVDEEERGALGIMGQDITSDIASAYNIPQGIYVTDFSTDSAAQDAGMQSKDILVKFDGTTVTTVEGLQKILKTYAAGETVTVTVKRCESGEYVEHELTVTLGKAATTSQTVSSDEEDSAQFGGNSQYGNSQFGSFGFGR